MQKISGEDVDELEAIQTACTNADDSIEITIRGFTFTTYELGEAVGQLLQQVEDTGEEDE